MKFNKWTVGLAAAGVVSLASVAQAEEKKSTVETALSHTVISGYVDTSFIYRTGGGNGTIPGRSYDQGGGGLGPTFSNPLNKQDGFNLNVVKLTIEKPVDEGQWAAGYKVDLLYGPDANVYNTASLGVTAQDFAIKQAYVALRVPVGNGLDLKVGVFDTIIGYEVFEAGNNPNYSRSYGFFLEPNTYTGVLASYRICDMIAVSGGVANTPTVVGPVPGLAVGNTINGRQAASNSRFSYMGSVALTAPESTGFLKGSTLYAGFVGASQPVVGGPSSDRINLYVGGTIKTPVEGLSVGAAWDHVYNGVSEGSYADALALYVSFQATEKMRLNVRGEYTAATAGTYTGVKSGVNDEKFISVVGTVDYSLWANVITRLEARYDQDASGGADPYNIGSSSGGGPENYAFSLALNVIYKF